MSNLRTPLDRNGTPIALGDVVTFEQATQGLLRGLPAEDQAAIRQQVGNLFEIVGFNDQGNPELEFVDQAGDHHTIWVEKSCVAKAVAKGRAESKN
jgi:hypothetical protein